MKIVEFVAVGGTGSLQRDKEWTAANSSFSHFALKRGLVNLAYRATYPYIWTGNVNFGVGSKNDWVAGGSALFSYLASPLHPEWRIPGDRTHVIAHSHGGQVALYAASFGLKINVLITVGTPVVKGMEPVIQQARPNIKRWLHLRSRRDWVQILGALFDGRLGFYRDMPLADWNDEMPKGHSDILRDPAQFRAWIDNGWFDFVKG